MELLCVTALIWLISNVATRETLSKDTLGVVHTVLRGICFVSRNICQWIERTFGLELADLCCWCSTSRDAIPTYSSIPSSTASTSPAHRCTNLAEVGTPMSQQCIRGSEMSHRARMDGGMPHSEDPRDQLQPDSIRTIVEDPRNQSVVGYLVILAPARSRQWPGVRRGSTRLTQSRSSRPGTFPHACDSDDAKNRRQNAWHRPESGNCQARDPSPSLCLYLTGEWGGGGGGRNLVA